MDTEYYDDIIIGGGKAGKTLAPALVANGRKTALGHELIIGMGRFVAPKTIEVTTPDGVEKVVKEVLARPVNLTLWRN